MGMGVLGLFWRGVSSCSNGPDGFVGDHHIVHLSRRDSGQTATQLDFENFLLPAGISLLKRFPRAKNRTQATGQGRVDFFVNQRIGLAKNLAAFAVAKDHIAHKKLSQHGRADLASEGT